MINPYQKLKRESNFFLSFTIKDLLLIMFFIILMGITLISNLIYRYVYLGCEAIILVVFLITYQDERVYILLIDAIYFLIKKKSYRQTKDFKYITKIEENCLTLINHNLVYVFVLKKENFLADETKLMKEYAENKEKLLISLNETQEFIFTYLQEENDCPHSAYLTATNKRVTDSYKDLLKQEKTYSDRFATSKKINEYLIITLKEENSSLKEEILTSPLIDKQLKGDELKQFINHYYNLDKPFFTSLKFFANRFVSEDKDYYLININSLPSNLDYDYLKELTFIDNINIYHKCRSLLNSEAYKIISNNYYSLNKSSLKETLKASQAEDSYLTSLSSLLEDNTLYETSLSIMCFTLDSFISVKAKLKQLNFKFTINTFKVEEALLNSTLMPGNNYPLFLDKGLIGNAYFPHEEKIDDKEGSLIAFNQDPCYFDLFYKDSYRTSSSMMILGRPGSGKSYFAKQLVLLESLKGKKVIIFDVEDEYTFLKDYGYQVIPYNSNPLVNPFKVIFNVSEQMIFLEDFFKVLIKDLTTQELKIILNSASKIYLKQSLFTFKDLYDAILEVSKNIEDDKEYDLYNQVLSKLEKYSLAPYVDIFSSQTESNLNSSLVFSLKELFLTNNQELINAYLLSLLNYLENKIYVEKEELILLIDEAHMIVNDTYLTIRNRLFALAKRCRKYQVALILISQSLSDFNLVQNGAASFLSLMQYLAIFKIAANEINYLSATLNSNLALKDNLYQISTFKQGECLFSLGENTITKMQIIDYHII